MLWKIALTMVVVWFMAGIIGMVAQKKRRASLLTGLCALSAALLGIALWQG